MSKLVVLLCLTLLVVGVVTAQEQPPACKTGGRICGADSECCVGLICNPWAGRCTKPKTTTPPPSTAAPNPGTEEA